MANLQILRSRLNALESQVYGGSQHTPHDSAGAAVAGRIDAVRRGLNREIQARPNVQEFLAKLDSIRDVLANETAALVSPDALPVQSQLELILDGLDEYKGIASQLRQIDELKDTLDKPLMDLIAPHASQLANLELRRFAQSAEVAEVSQQVREIMAAYNTYVQVTSELFISLHRSLTAIETAVMRAQKDDQ